MSVLVKEVVFQLIGVPNLLVCGQRKPSFGMAGWTVSETPRQYPPEGKVDEPTHRAPAQLAPCLVFST